MSGVSMELAGITVQSPVSAGTNLLLAFQCGWYASRLHRARLPGREVWAGLFGFLAVGAALGVVKHGFPHLLPDPGVQAVRAGSNLALCAGVTCLQLGAIQRHVAPGRAGTLAHFLAGLLLGTVLLVNSRDRAMGPTAALMALGLAPVLLAEARHAWAAHRGQGLAAGLGVALLGGSAYALDVSPSRWLTRTDVAHVAFLLALPLIHRGARDWLSGQDDAREEGVASLSPERREGGGSWR